MSNDFTIDNKIASDPPARPLAKYPGSKNRIAKEIIRHFPAAHGTFVLPFGGMASTLFKKNRSGIEVYNDLNGDVVNLFSVMRDMPYELIRKIELTPWSTEEFLTCQEPTDDPVERARRFYTLLWMAHYPFDKNPSFRRQMKYSRGASGKSSMVAAAKLFSHSDYLYDVAERLRGVVIERIDAVKLIKLYDYPEALFYCDPPYVHVTRQRTAHYLFEMNTEEHIKLADTLNNIYGMAVLSGYRSTIYEQLYERNGWRRIDVTARTNGRDKVESFWINPFAQEQLDAEAAQLKLL